ncbi:MAG: T9SS type A sorting domain-containing protein [Melioribacter sp.]|uniref:LamG-like jellyroll fold domain-containing protein n=1 Tax=Rosettibacter primus TaxID=3111523 RepID=UPI00247C74A9|nr:T9SS type A sorting domain-containing protein [Melioribacter sp.]
MFLRIKKLFIINLILFFNCYSQQIEIERIEKMPNIPSPYEMRDWKAVARGYDSLIYNLNANGEYLPLIFLFNSSINYPDEISFGLHSYVGTNSPNNSEAINVLPSIISATLIGIDKRNQNGFDWVKMSREYFNKRPEMNVYKNSPHNDTYDDWWYETMPNVFFYQLYSLYTDVEDYDYQFRIIADRFLEVAKLSGGSTTPWQYPNFNYRGWDFINKKSYKIGVEEPEAAGAIAYILYNAYVTTRDKKYLIGAEWCLEFLNSLTINPAYEIQLPYGVYTAVRMNAEIGTDYDIEKMFNWCFSFTNLRKWNVLLGKWGIYDINGLIGEDFDRQYAFSMNTFQQIGALVPVARYDERFARAIGKWVLNAANSLRLFYSKYLDDIRQDSEDWAHKYDPNSYIAYEALLKSNSNWPEATGDAIKGGWAKTNLSLYSSSSVGYLASIVDTTNVSKILKLNLNKTDFFQKNSYPTFLLFNPYEESKSVRINLPDGIFDIYETINNSFLAKNISNDFDVLIPANSAIIIVLTPSNGKIEYKMNKLLIDGVVVDYNVNQQVSNHQPRIKSLAAVSEKLIQNRSTKIYCTAVDKDNDQLKYYWQVSEGSILGGGSYVDFVAPNKSTTAIIKVIVEDTFGEKDSASLSIDIVSNINHSPDIKYIKAIPRKINLGEKAKLICYAEDIDNDSLSFNWNSKFGYINQTSDSAMWTAPDIEGDYYVICTVRDGKGGIARDSLKIMVRNFSESTFGKLIMYLPFNGNGNDESGNGNNGIIYGAIFVNDRFGKSNSALQFDGINDYILIKNSPSLNFQNAITISFWIKLDELSEKESYIISHGSYDKRYKVSIANKKLRWTIKTDKTGNGILDLDSESQLVLNKFIHCIVNYNGKDAELWINGELNSFASWTGKLQLSDIDLTIAQMLPANSNYNFKGIIDDVRIYDYALMPDEIYKLNDIPSSVKEYSSLINSNEIFLYNFPNPFNSNTVIIYQILELTRVQLKIYDILGKEIKLLFDETQSPGIFEIKWDGKNNYGNVVPSGIYFCILRTNQNMKIKKLILMK